MYSKSSPFKLFGDLFLLIVELPYFKSSPFLHSDCASTSMEQEKTRIQANLLKKEPPYLDHAQKYAPQYLIHNRYSNLSPVKKWALNPHPRAIQTYHHSIQSTYQCDPKISPVTLKYLTQIAASSLLSTCLIT